MIPIPLQTAADAIKLLSVESVSVIGLLLCFCGYQVWQNHLLKQENKAKDEKIDQIVSEHRNDLKDNTKDAVAMLNRYHTFVEQLSALTRHGKTN